MNNNNSHLNRQKTGGVEVRNGDFKGAMRTLKKRLEESEFQKELSKHQFYEAPSSQNKRSKAAAKKRWRKKISEMRKSGNWVDQISYRTKHLKTKRKRRKVMEQQQMLRELRRQYD